MVLDIIEKFLGYTREIRDGGSLSGKFDGELPFKIKKNFEALSCLLSHFPL